MFKVGSNQGGTLLSFFSIKGITQMSKEHILSNGKRVWMKDVNTSATFTTGATWPTNSYGKITVVGQVGKNKEKNIKQTRYVVCFDDGNTYLTSSAYIRTGKIANKSGVRPTDITEPYTLTDGSIILKQVKNTSTKYTTGNVFPTNQYGDITIVGQVYTSYGDLKDTQYIVQFAEGTTYLKNRSEITAGGVTNLLKSIDYINHILSDGTVLTLYTDYISQDYYVGSEHNTLYNGKIQVVGREKDSFKYVIKFEDSNTYLVSTATIARGEIGNRFKDEGYDKGTHRKCSTCEKIKLFAEFNIRSGVPCGRQGVCRVCQQEKMDTNPLLRLRSNLSSSFGMSLKKIDTCKPSGTMTYVGCTMEELKTHINKGQYTLEDYAKNKKEAVVYDCDHIIPSEYYMDKLETDENDKITKETEPWLYKWWNYRNLRIWPSGPNRSKGAKMDKDLIKQHGIEDLLTL